LALIAAGVAEEPGRPFPERETAGGRLTYVDDVPVMFLSGSPEDLGRQQAELVGGTIAPLLGITRDVVAQHGYQRIWPFVAATSRVLLKNAPEAHQQELEAFAAGGQLDRDGLYVGNSLVELRRIGGCSTFVVLPRRSASGELLFGRNFDFPAFGVLDRLSCVLVVRPTGKRAFVSVGYPGLIGVLSGMNDAGLTVATMDVYESADGAPIFDPSGVPLALTYRRILEECATVAEAEQLLRSTKITTFMNLAVADRERAAVFELTPATVGMRPPQDELLACTNHFQLDGLRTDPQCRRIKTLNGLRSRSKKFTLQDVERTLHDVNQGEITIQSMVFEPSTLRLHLAVGGRAPVSNHTYHRLDAAAWLAPLPAPQ